MNLNFEYYKVFYYVCKCGSLTAAANVLMTSQPAVTRTIHNLENAIGCRLFIRSKNGVELTPEGRTFYKYISAACAQIFKGEKRAGRHDQPGQWNRLYQRYRNSPALLPVQSNGGI